MSVWHCPDFVICLTERSPGRKKIVLKWRKSLEFRLIRWQILSFGVGPTLIAYRMGMNHGIGVTILMFYVLAGLIRLAWYNVSEEIRQEETTENRECYQGLPITSMAVALPILYVFRPILGKDFIIALHALVLIIGLLFITNFRLRKPKKLGQTVMVIIVALAVLHGLHIW